MYVQIYIVQNRFSGKKKMRYILQYFYALAEALNLDLSLEFLLSNWPIFQRLIEHFLNYIFFRKTGGYSMGINIKKKKQKNSKNMIIMRRCAHKAIEYFYEQQNIWKHLKGY